MLKKSNVNLKAIWSTIIMYTLISILYYIKIGNGESNFLVLGIIIFIGLATNVSASLIYKNNKNSNLIRYIILVGVCIPFLYTIIKTQTIMAYAFVVPILLASSFFLDKKTTMFVIGLTTPMSIYFIYRVFSGSIVATSTEKMSILIFSLLFQFFTFLTAHLNDSMIKTIKEKEEELKKTAKRSKELANKIIDVSHTLTKASSEFNDKNIELSKGIAEINISVEEIANGSNSQSMDTQDIASNIVNLGDIVKNNKKDSRLVNDSISNIVLYKDKGIESMKILRDSSKESGVAMKSVSDVVILTNENALKITKETETIKEIASQINLLSLNATIEAARAGDAGRGFSVVAEEIRKLSVQTDSLVDNIEKDSNSLITSSNEAVENLKEIQVLVKNQNQEIENLDNIFIDTDKATKSTLNAVKSLNKSGEDISKNRNELDDSIQNLVAVTEENSANTEEVSATLQNQETSVDKMLEENKKVTNLANELKDKSLEMKMLIEVEEIIEEVEKKEENNEITNDSLREIAKDRNISSIYITDERGYVKYCNEKNSIGINLYEIDPSLRNLKKGEEFITTPIKLREEDGKLYKFLAILRNDIIYEVGICLE